MGIADYGLLALLGAILALAVGKISKDKRRGKTCSGNCAGCSCGCKR